MFNVYNELVNQSKNLYFDPCEIENFISQEELETCIDIYNELPVFAPASHERATRKDFLMYSESDKRMQDIFLPKLQALAPDKQFRVDGGNFTEWYSPVVIHTDGYQFEYKDIDNIVDHKSVLGYVLLVPLKTDTGKGTPNTIFFDQKHFGGSVDFKKSVDDLEFRNSVEDYTFKEFDFTSPVAELLTHVPKNWLHGFSVQKILPWKFGNAIIWHRAQFHCASRFKDYNSKTHLVFFVNFV